MNRRLVASYLALTIVVLAALEIPLGIVNQRNERQDLTAKLERDAFVLATGVEEALHQQPPARRVAQAAAMRYQRAFGGRVVVVDRRGRTVADSAPTVPGETGFVTPERPEFATALSGRTASGIRRSHTLGTGLLYVAVPVASGRQILGALRITYSTKTLDNRVRRYWLTLFGVGVIVLAAAAVIGVALARSVTRPLRRVEQTAAQVGAGDLSARAPTDEGPPEVRRLARELNDTTAKLDALLRSQEQFVADASHELRTPLTALRLRLENVDPVPEEAVAEAERLGRIVDELLALARAGAPGEAAADVDLGALVRERIELWEPLAAERGVRLELVGEGAMVRAGDGRIGQVLDNLLSNALDVSSAGKTISVVLERGELHVVDEGPGLTVEQRARAFDRFWRAGGGADGSGLGLAIARRLVEVDNGSIELREAPSGGVDARVVYERGSGA